MNPKPKISRIRIRKRMNAQLPHPVPQPTPAPVPPTAPPVAPNAIFLPSLQQIFYDCVIICLQEVNGYTVCVDEAYWQIYLFF